MVTAVTGQMKGVKGVQEQARGMKVRSSVKKLCEGCKVRHYTSLVLECRTDIVRTVKGREGCGPVYGAGSVGDTIWLTTPYTGCAEERRQEREGLCVHHLLIESKA